MPSFLASFSLPRSKLQDSPNIGKMVLQVLASRYIKKTVLESYLGERWPGDQTLKIQV